MGRFLPSATDLVSYVALAQAFGNDPPALHIAGSFIRFHFGHSTPFHDSACARLKASHFSVQIIGMINNIDAPFPSGVAEYIGIAAIAQLNLEIMQLSCIFGEAEDAYYSRVRLFFWIPIVLVGALCLVYAARVSLWRLKPATPDSEPSASAADSDRAQRFRDQLCSWGCSVFNMMYGAEAESVFAPAQSAASDRSGWQVRTDGVGQLVRLQLQRARRRHEPADSSTSVELFRRSLAQRKSLRDFDAHPVGHDHAALPGTCAPGGAAQAAAAACGWSEMGI